MIRRSNCGEGERAESEEKSIEILDGAICSGSCDVHDGDEALERQRV